MPRSRGVSWNDDLINDYRKNGKATQGPFVGRPVLLLTTAGSKSGAAHTVPLVYTKDGDDLIIVASKGGAPTHPDWFHNLKAHSTVNIELGKERFEAKAIPTSLETERERLYAAHAEVHPGFLDYVKKTTRKIPVIRLRRLASAAS